MEAIACHLVIEGREIAGSYAAGTKAFPFLGELHETCQDIFVFLKRLGRTAFGFEKIQIAFPHLLPFHLARHLAAFTAFNPFDNLVCAVRIAACLSEVR